MKREVVGQKGADLQLPHRLDCTANRADQDKHHMRREKGWAVASEAAVCVGVVCECCAE